uniref:Uncharacterized protein n=1 Tax=Vespula pensylvanica TaxID=30213 RepID=A0A834K4Y1_VESPE|nr:hypothetical protein H0235_015692 [Vespula pensylvanica]
MPRFVIVFKIVVSRDFLRGMSHMKLSSSLDARRIPDGIFMRVFNNYVLKWRVCHSGVKSFSMTLKIDTFCNLLVGLKYGSGISLKSLQKGDRFFENHARVSLSI